MWINPWMCKFLSFWSLILLKSYVSFDQQVMGWWDVYAETIGDSWRPKSRPGGLTLSIPPTIWYTQSQNHWVAMGKLHKYEDDIRWHKWNGPFVVYLKKCDWMTFTKHLPEVPREMRGPWASLGRSTAISSQSGGVSSMDSWGKGWWDGKFYRLFSPPETIAEQ